MGADVNMEVAIELKVRVGLETEMVKVREKSEVTVGLEAETVMGTESGVDMKVGTNLKLMVDTSGNISLAAGAKAGVGCVVVSAAADAGVEMGLMVVGTDNEDDVVVVAGVEVCMIVEMIPSACVVVSELSVPANAQLGIVGMGRETAE